MAVDWKCLVIGSSTDPHIHVLLPDLQSRGINCSLLDIDREPDFVFTSRNSVVDINVNGMAFREYDVVLNRMKWRYDPHCLNREAFNEYFFYFEWIYALRGLTFVADIVGTPVVNHPFSGLFGANKILQLVAAAQCGLTTPETFIGTNPNVLKEMAGSWPRMVAKVFESSFVPPLDGHDAQSIMTNEFSKSDLMGYSAAIREDPPLIMQRLIEKAVEARVIASTSSSVCYIINSQEHESSKIDWRQREPVVTYELGDVPGEVVSSMRKLLGRLKLDYATFDFAVMPTGEWVFFECNPDGQWWHARQRAGGEPERIIASIVESRMKSARDSRAFGNFF